MGDLGGFEGTSEIHALGLSPDEKADLALFLHALDGPGPDAVAAEEPVEKTSYSAAHRWAWKLRPLLLPNRSS